MTVATAPFVDIVRDVSGGNEKLPQSQFLPIGALPVIDQGQGFIAGYTDDESYRFRSDRLPVVVFGDHTKTVKYVDFPFAMGADGVKVLKPRAECDAKYLYHFLRQAKIPDAGYSRHFKFLKELRVPLPPLAEQCRIAAILDKADALRAKRNEVIAKLDQLLQSVFLDMFGDPVANPRGWPKVALATLTRKIGSGATPKGGDSAYHEEGTSFIRSLNVHDGKFRYKNLAFIDDEQAKKLDGVAVESGDVLLNITGASVARVCRVPDDVLPARVNQHVAIIRCSAGLSPEFLEHVLMSPSMKNVLLGVAGAGATREAITKRQIEALLVPVPPASAQGKFTAVVDEILQQRRRALGALDKQENLFASLQRAAFSGEI